MERPSPRLQEFPDQMPGRLARIDDPWGIGWRASNFVRRFSLRRWLRLSEGLVRNPRYERPVFVIGPPRSGTTMLWQLLQASGQLASLPREGHDLWRTFHHPRYSGWSGDPVGAGQVRPGERRYVRAYFYSFFGERRFVEKTADNALRIPYLLELFPDAIFLGIKRNPSDVISSLINGWRHPAGRYRSYYVPVRLRIPGYPHERRWCFSLIEGWRDLVASPVPEIAFAQWDAYVRGFEAGRRLVPAERWHELHFETLLERPREVLEKLCEWAEIAPGAAMVAKLDELIAVPVNALSAPERHKWRRDNPGEVGALLPRIAARAGSLGYAVDPRTGEIEIVS